MGRAHAQQSGSLIIIIDASQSLRNNCPLSIHLEAPAPARIDPYNI